MNYHYPTPAEAGIQIPRNLIIERFNKGFLHALKGGQIREREQLRLSFREGYRAGKLYIRELRRAQGVLEFPMKARMRFRNAA